MDAKLATEAFGALAQDTRLAVFRLLVEAGAEGMPAGDIARRLGTSHNTMSSHCEQDHERDRYQQADGRRQHDPEQRLAQPLPNDGRDADLRQGGADQTADQRVRTAGRDPGPPREDVPRDRPGEGAEDHPGVDDVGGDDALAERLRDVQAEEQEGDEVEERGQHHRALRRKHARRDDGRDGVGGVVRPVDEVEEQREADQPDEQGQR